MPNVPAPGLSANRSTMRCALSISLADGENAALVRVRQALLWGTLGLAAIGAALLRGFLVALFVIYALLAIPLAVMLWLRLRLVRESLIAVARMTVQLLFVGFYLGVVFKINSAWLNALWLLVMIASAMKNSANALASPTNGLSGLSMCQRCRLMNPASTMGSSENTAR